MTYQIYNNDQPMFNPSGLDTLMQALVGPRDMAKFGTPGFTDARIEIRNIDTGEPYEFQTPDGPVTSFLLQDLPDHEAVVAFDESLEAEAEERFGS